MITRGYWPCLKLAAFVAEILILWPVRGVLPARALRFPTGTVPKPSKFSVSFKESIAVN